MGRSVVPAATAVSVAEAAAPTLQDDALHPRGTGDGGPDPPFTRCTVVREGWRGEPQEDRATPLVVTVAGVAAAAVETPPELPPTAAVFEADVHSVAPRVDGLKDITRLLKKKKREKRKMERENE